MDYAKRKFFDFGMDIFNNANMTKDSGIPLPLTPCSTVTRGSILILGKL